MRGVVVPKTSAKRGKRRKVMHGCRLCKREWSAEYQALRDGLRTAPSRQKGLRHHCNGGVWDT